MSSESRVRTFVYGSEVVGFDTLRTQGDRYQLVRFVHRQSVISGMSRPVVLDPPDVQTPTAMRALDDAKSSLMMWTRLDREQVDLFLWDLTDERFGVEDLGNDRYRTLTPDYGDIPGGLAKFDMRRQIPFGSDEHFELFQHAASRFVALLNSVGLGSRTLVLAPEVQESVGVAEGEHANLHASLNRKWRRYWQYLHEVCQLSIAVVPSTTSFSDEQHRWGPAPFHFDSATLGRLGECVAAFTARGIPAGRASRLPVVRPNFRDVTSISLEAFAATPPVDGVYNVRVGDTVIPLLLNIYGRRVVRRIPVIFSGALGPGQQVLGPVFSGREMCRSLELPLVSIADPSIGLLPHNELGWYMGSAWHDTQIAINLLLMQLSRSLDAPLLFVGGSGGGYASVDQLARTSMDQGHGAIVWNPQLDISGYGQMAVERFLATSFPGIYLKHGSGRTPEALREIERRFGAVSEILSAAQHGGLKRLLLLQQRSDWHYDRFLVPLGDRLGVTIPDVGPWVGPADVAGFVGEWGSGHVPPPRELLEAVILSAATSEKSMAELAREIG